MKRKKKATTATWILVRGGGGVAVCEFDFCVTKNQHTRQREGRKMWGNRFRVERVFFRGKRLRFDGKRKVRTRFCRLHQNRGVLGGTIKGRGGDIRRKRASSKDTDLTISSDNAAQKKENRLRPKEDSFPIGQSRCQEGREQGRGWLEHESKKRRRTLTPYKRHGRRSLKPRDEG